MLRKRLYSGLLPLLTLLVVLNIFIILQIKNLDSTFEKIQEENYSAILSLRELSTQSARLPVAAMLSRSGQDDPARAVVEDAFASMRRELSSLRNLIADEQEHAMIYNLWDAYRALGELMRPYRDDLEPTPPENVIQIAVARLSAQVEELVAYNTSLMQERTAKFRSQTRLSNYIILFTTAFAIIAALVFSNLTSRRIVTPIEKLTESARELARGSWDIVVDQSGKDEIGDLSRVLNDMILQLREYRRLTDRKILRSRRRMASFLDNAVDAIFFVNSSMQPTYMNPRARRLFDSLDWENEGLPEELEEDIDRVLKQGSAVVAGDLGSALVFTISEKPQAFLPLISPLETDEVEGPEVAVVLQDVTKMRLANDLKQNLLATVSHEIKTPLTSARMSLYLVLDGALGPLNEKQQDLLESTRGDLERLLTLLNNILDFARLEAGVSQLKLQAADPLALLRWAQSEFRVAAQAQHIELEVVEPQDTLSAVPVDRGRIQVVLTNLINNAMKHSPQHSRIRLYARKDGDGVRMGVIDQGAGIPKEATHAVFERKYDLQGNTSGIGLSVSREIIVAHGGAIGFESNPEGQGTDFYFILPGAEA